MLSPKLFISILLFGFVETVTPAQSPSPIDTSGWKVYRNETMGFEVKHPTSWKVGLVTGSMEGVNLGPTPEVGKANVSIQFIIQRKMNPKGLSIAQWYADQLKMFKSMQPPPENTFIGGRPAVRRERKSTFGRNIDFFTSLKKADVIQISIIQPSSEVQLEQMYETILSTVKFIK